MALKPAQPIDIELSSSCSTQQLEESRPPVSAPAVSVSDDDVLRAAAAGRGGAMSVKCGRLASLSVGEEKVLVRLLRLYAGFVRSCYAAEEPDTADACGALASTKETSAGGRSAFNSLCWCFVRGCAALVARCARLKGCKMRESLEGDVIGKRVLPRAFTIACAAGSKPFSFQQHQLRFRSCARGHVASD